MTTPGLMTIHAALQNVENEVIRAKRKHLNDFFNHHEAYAVIKEEFDEYWAEVCKGGSTPRDEEALRTELIQTAAMCVRALVELC